MRERVVSLYKRAMWRGTLLGALLAAVACLGWALAQSPPPAVGNDSSPQVLSDSSNMAPAFLETQIPSFAELPAKTLAVDQPPDCSRVACLALTFDDGPDRDTTPVILSALEAAQVQATFFLIGSRVAPDHDIVQRMYRDHDDIGDHSWTHPDLTKLPPDQIASQIALTQAAISAAGVPAPTFVRPPYGAVNPTVLSSVPLPLVLWNVDPRDWAETDPAKIEATVETQVKPGAIVLMHDSKPATAAAVAAILTNLKTRYHLVTVSELLHITAESQGQYFSLYTHR